MVKTGKSGKVMSAHTRHNGNGSQPPALMEDWQSLVPILSAGGVTSHAPLPKNRMASHVSWPTVLAYTGFVITCVVIGVAAGLTWLGDVM